MACIHARDISIALYSLHRAADSTGNWYPRNEQVADFDWLRIRGSFGVPEEEG